MRYILLILLCVAHSLSAQMMGSNSTLENQEVLYNAAFFSVTQGSSATIGTRQVELEPSVAGVDRAMSWSGWYKISNFPSTAAQRMFQSATLEAANNNQYVLSLTGVDAAAADNQKIRFILHTNTTNYIYIQSQNKVLRNRWLHIVITYDGSEANTGFEMYINGVLEGSPTRSGLGTYTGAWNNAAFRFQLSKQNSSASTKYTGFERDVAIWDKELSQTEVNELYNSGLPIDVENVSFYGNIEAYWPLRSDLTCENSATFDFTDSSTGTAIVFRETELGVRHKQLSLYQVQPGNTRYVAFGGLFPTTGTTAYWNGRSGTSHVLNGKIVKYAIDYSTGVVSSGPTDIITSANDLRGGSAGVIDGDVYNFYARYDGGADTFFDLNRNPSTDGLTGETFAGPTTMPVDLSRFNFYGKVTAGFSAGHYFVPQNEGDGAGATEVNVYKTEDNGSTWNKIQVWAGSDIDLQEPALINLGNVGGNNTMMIISRSATNGLYRVVSTDGGATWGSPALTNLGTALDVSCADMALDEQGRVHVIYMDRNDGRMYISTKNYISTILASATSFTTPVAIVQSYTTDSYPILGYPNIIFVGGKKVLITYSLEFSSSRADLFMGVGTFYDNK